MVPFPPPGFPRINAKWLSSSGSIIDMDDMALEVRVDMDRRATTAVRVKIIIVLASWNEKFRLRFRQGRW
jgi:hypothetical protein